MSFKAQHFLFVLNNTDFKYLEMHCMLHIKLGENKVQEMQKTAWNVANTDIYKQETALVKWNMGLGKGAILTQELN